MKKLTIITFSLIYLFVLDVGFLLAQIPDITPPQLVSFDFEPKIIDATGTQQPLLHTTVTIRDDSSGPGGITCRFLKDDNASDIGCGVSISSTFSPDGLTRTDVLETKVAQFKPPGRYLATNLFFCDNAGNCVTLHTGDLQTKGFPVELFNGNTPPGQNIVVGPLSGVTITYTEVTSGGQTTVISSSSGTTPPSGFKLGTPPTYYSVSTTAQFNPPVTVCINYDDTQFKNEKNLKLFHFENGRWVNATTSLDTISNIICGQASSFSEFGLFEDITVDHIADEVKSFNLESGIQQSLLDKLTAAKSAIERGQNKTARNILKAFINLVEAQKGKKITNEQAQILLTDTKALINSLGGFSLNSFFKFLLFGWLDKIINAMIGNKI